MHRRERARLYGTPLRSSYLSVDVRFWECVEGSEQGLCFQGQVLIFAKIGRQNSVCTVLQLNCIAALPRLSRTNAYFSLCSHLRPSATAPLRPILSSRMLTADTTPCDPFPSDPLISASSLLPLFSPPQWTPLLPLPFLLQLPLLLLLPPQLPLQLPPPSLLQYLQE